MKKSLSDKDIQVFIGRFLRIGALLSCAVVMVGGILYLYKHGLETVPNFMTFKAEIESFTTLSGIWNGVLIGSSTEIIQLGIILLIATPILRIVFSLFSFVIEKDKLYICITIIVLSVILFSMFSGMEV